MLDSVNSSNYFSIQIFKIPSPLPSPKEEDDRGQDGVSILPIDLCQAFTFQISIGFTERFTPKETPVG